MKLSSQTINIIIILSTIILIFFYFSFGVFSFSKYKFILNSDSLNLILFHLRLPRIILALVVGAGLASSGVVFQGILRNPLAEPYTLGIAGMVVLFVNLGLFLSNIFGLNYDKILSNSFFAFFGAICSVFLVYGIFVKRKFGMTKILLVGIMINIISISFVEILSNIEDYTKVYSSKFWLIGNLTTPLDFMFLPISIFIFLSIYFFYKKGKIIDILSLGEEHAVYLGLDVRNEQKKLFLLASIVCSFCVAYTGIIGFIGLMVPHISRYFIGEGNKSLIITSSILGAFCLLFSDFLAKTVFYPMELGVGVVTGFVGGIFFVSLVLKKGIHA